ncbi:RDD family protein [Alkanindiges sp. WGS2144]|uniref:RDD family protein n=1 Tax=Alkanindiges sp. WGS2144 TaxID=3366808 RepID=UPI003753B40E
MQIYLARNNEQAGPYTLEQVNQMLANGQVVLNDLAWHEGMSEWKPLGELTQGKMVYQPTLTVPFSIPSTVAKAATTDRSSQSPKNTDLASINKRVLAKILDILLLWIPSSFIFGQFITPDFLKKYQEIAGSAVIPSAQQQEQMLALLSTLPAAAYYSLGFFALGYFILQAYLLHKSGQTIGKKALGIMIVDDQSGEKTSITRSFLLRSIVFIIFNYFIFLVAIVDFAFIFTERRRTMHDRLARTIVVNIPKQ